MSKDQYDTREGVRIAHKYKGKAVYTSVVPGEIFCTAPLDQETECTLTALTRIISKAVQHGVSPETIKNQLRKSTLSKHDLPAILLEAIEKAEERGCTLT